MFEAEFVEDRRRHLLNKKESKTKIFARGGEHALLHDPREITRIDFALRRIDEDQYGLCTNCGSGIDTERLIQLPETPFCVSCAQDVEKQPHTH